MKRWIGIVLCVGGVVVALVAALADVIGLGDATVFGPRQIIGTVVGVLVLVVGLVLALRGD